MKKPKPAKPETKKPVATKVPVKKEWRLVKIIKNIHNGSKLLGFNRMGMIVLGKVMIN
jgi:hypothetical protein